MKINYLNRRLNVQKKLLVNSILLLTNYPTEENNETNSNFYYLTGLSISTPVCLFLTWDGKFGLIADHFARNPWNGDQLSKNYLGKFGFKYFYLINELDLCFNQYLNHKIVMVHPFTKEFSKLLEYLKNKFFTIELIDLLKSMRMIKDEAEIYSLVQAAKITTQAFKKIQLSPKIDLYEGELSCLFNKNLYQQNSIEAFKTIVASGKNTTILHYQGYHRKIRQDDLILVDAGASFNHYACDVTRVYPASGKFSVAQKKLYKLVLYIQQTVIKQIKPGITFLELQEMADKITYLGLKKLGILNKIIKLKELTIHSIGHWLGLNVHDLGDYQIPLQPGMVLTIEPGIYLGEKFGYPWKNLGIRIEDTVLVTKTGYKILTAKIPKTIKSLEKSR